MPRKIRELIKEIEAAGLLTEVEKAVIEILSIPML